MLGIFKNNFLFLNYMAKQDVNNNDDLFKSVITWENVHKIMKWIKLILAFEIYEEYNTCKN